MKENCNVDVRKCVCKYCKKEFISYTGNVRYCSQECRDKAKESNKVKSVCDVCGAEFMKSPFQKANYCSEKCRVYIKNQKYRKKIIDNRSEELSKGIEGYDYVTCKICGHITEQLNTSHLMNVHGITLSEYREKYPDAKFVCQRLVDSCLKGENNPRHHTKISEQEIKENSPFCKEFYEKRGLTEQDRLDFISRAEADRNIDTRIEYYLKLGMTESEAKEALAERQRTFTLDKCIEKYGEEEGKRRWEERQQNWAEVMKVKYENGEYDKTPHNLLDSLSSQIEQKFIKDLHNKLNIDINESHNSLSTKNQYVIYSSEHRRRFMYDFEYNGKIIEFNGDFWHANPEKYTEDAYIRDGKCAKDVWENDKVKLNVAECEGKTVFVVWESEYRSNPDVVIKRCIDYLNETEKMS